MKKSIVRLKRNWYRRVLGIFSFTAVMFAFQACYGSPQDNEFDVMIEGVVKSMTSNLPLNDIQVSLEGRNQFVLTDEQGNFSFYTSLDSNYALVFEDTDGDANGSFLRKDTTIKAEDLNFLEIYLVEN